jgi:hypothetical protein
MTLWLSALAALIAAVCLLLVERRTERAEADWIRAVVQQVNPAGYQELADRAAAEPDLSNIEAIPEELRPLCPAPPFVAAIYHHTCGSCQELWREIDGTPELSAVHMVYSAGKAELLRKRGLLREPTIALPDELMDSLPSGLAIRVDAEWRIADLQLATTTTDLRALIGETTRSA